MWGPAGTSMARISSPGFSTVSTFGVAPGGRCNFANDIRREPAGPSLGGNRVAVIEVEGLIVDAERVVRELERQADSPSVRAVVVRVQSPGGVVAPTQEIYAAIGQVREQGKPVVASLQDVAASGAYYVSCGADTVIAHPTSIVGSIGVIFSAFSFAGTIWSPRIAAM